MAHVDVDAPTLQKLNRARSWHTHGSTEWKDFICVIFYMLLMKIIHFVCDFFLHNCMLKFVNCAWSYTQSIHAPWLVAGAGFSVKPIVHLHMGILYKLLNGYIINSCKRKLHKACKYVRQYQHLISRIVYLYILFRSN